MQTYNVKLAEGVFVKVNADNPEDATAKAKAEIAKRQGSIAYDKVYFDYDTGIQDNRLRAGLSVAEDYMNEDGEFISEKENYLKQEVGSDGFIRDSKGSIALTPIGQARLGLEPSNKNIVIDENKAFTSGDFADMAGYAGPILGAIAAVNPYLRGIKYLRGLLGSRVGRPLLVGAGSAAGKGVEEANEIARGVQLQNEEELANLYKREFLIGGIAQGAGEVLGGVFATYFGKTATHGAIRDSKLIMQGYDLTDIFKLDAQIAAREGVDPTNYKASINAIQKEIKKQKIKPKFTPGIVPQSALGRTIPARGQSIAEAVTGAKPRENRAQANLVQMMNSFFQSLGRKNATVDDFIESGAVGQIAKKELLDIQSNMQKGIQVSDEKLDSLLRLMVDEMGVSKGLMANGQLQSSENLRRALSDEMKKIWDAWNKSNNKMYESATAALQGTKVNTGISAALKNSASRFKDLQNKFDSDDVFAQYSGAYVKLKDLAEGQIDNLTQLKNAKMEFRAVLKDATVSGKTGGTTYRLAKEVIEEIDQLQKDIINKKAFVGMDDITKADINEASKAFTLLAKADNDFAKNIDKFSGTLYQNIIRQAKTTGKVDVDEVFGFIDNPTSSAKLQEIFAALGPKADSARGQLTALLFKNVIADSIDPVTKLINPVKFTTNIMKYDSKEFGKSTLKELFGPEYNVNMGLLREINILNPKITKKDLNALINNIETNPSMFRLGMDPVVKTGNVLDREGTKVLQVDTGNQILKTILEKAKIQSSLDDLNKQSFMKNALNDTPERIVANVFGPGSAKEINYLKAALADTPETFKQIQENAMGQLLTKAVSTGKLSSSGKLADIFKPNVLRNTLESYGDDTLIAMFGKEQTLALKALQQSLDLQVGAAQGLTAGGIVAGAIGAQALNISLLPTIVALKIFGNVFANPRIVKLMANTDQTSTMMVIDAFEKAARLASAQAVAQQSEDAQSIIMEQLREQLEGEGNQERNTKIKEQVQGITNQIPTTVPDLPDIIPTAAPPINRQNISRSLLGSPANEDIARSLNQIA
jgi:hypothetical protein